MQFVGAPQLGLIWLLLLVLPRHRYCLASTDKVCQWHLPVMLFILGAALPLGNLLGDLWQTAGCFRSVRPVYYTR
jgi:hypothetical protein